MDREQDRRAAGQQHIAAQLIPERSMQARWAQAPSAGVPIAGSESFGRTTVGSRIRGRDA
jgi:hypothetical protein